MNKKQRAVIQAVNEEHKGRISTHYEDCWKYHAGCLAWLLKNLEEEK